MTAEKLDTAIQLIQTGRKQTAVPVLREIIQENPADENAWLLLSECMDEKAHKKFCLERVLAINPVNWEARDALAALRDPEAPLEPAPPKEIARQKMEWEREDEPKEYPEKAPQLKMDWEEEPAVPIEPPKRKPVKALPPAMPRRKSRRKRFSIFPALAFTILFVMLGTVFYVFVQAIVTLLTHQP